MLYINHSSIFKICKNNSFGFKKMVNTMTKLKNKSILLAFVGILFLLLSSRSHVFAEWSSIGAVTQTSVSQASIASDGTNLLVFYRYPNVSLNLDEGIIKKCNGGMIGSPAGFLPGPQLLLLNE